MRSALAAAILAAGVAEAQDAPPRFNLATGETVSAGRDMVSGQFGWPSATLGFTHGLSEKSDVGLRFDLIYGVEGTTATQFGVGLGVPFRVVAVRKDKMSLLLQLVPGLTVYTYADAVFLLNTPLGATLGIQVSNDLRIAAGVDFVMKTQVTPRAHFWFAPLFGASFEYFVDRQLSVSLDTRFGPVIVSGGGDAEFGFRTQVGVAYRL